MPDNPPNQPSGITEAPTAEFTEKDRVTAMQDLLNDFQGELQRLGQDVMRIQQRQDQLDRPIAKGAPRIWVTDLVAMNVYIRNHPGDYDAHFEFPNGGIWFSVDDRPLRLNVNVDRGDGGAVPFEGKRYRLLLEEIEE